jgi:hypothetical protein
MAGKSAAADDLRRRGKMEVALALAPSHQFYSLA